MTKFANMDGAGGLKPRPNGLETRPYFTLAERLPAAPYLMPTTILGTFMQNSSWARPTVKDTLLPVHDTQVCTSFMTVIYYDSKDRRKSAIKSVVQSFVLHDSTM